MMKEFKTMKRNPTRNDEGDLWCIDCKEGHTKCFCAKKQFCNICQIVGNSTKKCLYNMKTRGPQLILITQEDFTSIAGATNTNTNTASYGGFRNNRHGGRGGNNGNNNNNNGGRSLSNMMQVDS